MTIKHGNTLFVHCDVIHPESGEVLAEPGGVLTLSHPVAQHILAVAEAHADHYFTYNDAYGNTAIATALEWQQ